MNTEPLTIEQRSRRSSIEKLGRISPAYELGYEQGYKEAVDNACRRYEEELRQFKSLLEFVKKNSSNVVDTEKKPR